MPKHTSAVVRLRRLRSVPRAARDRRLKHQPRTGARERAAGLHDVTYLLPSHRHPEPSARCGRSQPSRRRRSRCGGGTRPLIARQGTACGCLAPRAFVIRLLLAVLRLRGTAPACAPPVTAPSPPPPTRPVARQRARGPRRHRARNALGRLRRPAPQAARKHRARRRCLGVFEGGNREDGSRRSAARSRVAVPRRPAAARGDRPVPAGCDRSCCGAARGNAVHAGGDGRVEPRGSLRSSCRRMRP